MPDTLARPPVGWERILAKRALLSALGPLAGLRAEGNVIATATSAPVTLPAFTHGLPLLGGKLFYDRMVKTTAATTVTSSGTAVPVRAVCGGPGGNLDAGTVILWQPLPAGLAARGAVDGSGITGGVWQDGPGRCRRVTAYDTLGADPAKLIWEMPGDGLPAIIVGRTSDDPKEITTVASTLRLHTFAILIASANHSGNDERAEESELLLDAVESTLEGLEDVEGEVFSGPPVECGRATRIPPRSPNVHVWSIEARLYYALKRIDVRLSDGVSFQPWSTTRIEIAAPAEPPQAAHVVVDVKADESP